jgi:hypothetical protein
MRGATVVPNLNGSVLDSYSKQSLQLQQRIFVTSSRALMDHVRSRFVTATEQPHWELRGAFDFSPEQAEAAFHSLHYDEAKSSYDRHSCPGAFVGFLRCSRRARLSAEAVEKARHHARVHLADMFSPDADDDFGLPAGGASEPPVCTQVTAYWQTLKADATAIDLLHSFERHGLPDVNLITGPLDGRLRPGDVGGRNYAQFLQQFVVPSVPVDASLSSHLDVSAVSAAPGDTLALVADLSFCVRSLSLTPPNETTAVMLAAHALRKTLPSNVTVAIYDAFRYGITYIRSGLKRPQVERLGLNFWLFRASRAGYAQRRYSVTDCLAADSTCGWIFENDGAGARIVGAAQALAALDEQAFASPESTAHLKAARVAAVTGNRTLVVPFSALLVSRFVRAYRAGHVPEHVYDNVPAPPTTATGGDGPSSRVIATRVSGRNPRRLEEFLRAPGVEPAPGVHLTSDDTVFVVAFDPARAKHMNAGRVTRMMKALPFVARIVAADGEKESLGSTAFTTDNTRFPLAPTAGRTEMTARLSAAAAAAAPVIKAALFKASPWEVFPVDALFASINGNPLDVAFCARRTPVLHGDGSFDVVVHAPVFLPNALVLALGPSAAPPGTNESDAGRLYRLLVSDAGAAACFGPVVRTNVNEHAGAPGAADIANADL